MSDKLQQTREYILQKIETGELAGGAKLPAARELSEESGVSLTVAQLAFHSLTRDGILTSIPRQGTYVRDDWRRRILPGSIQSFRPVWTGLISDTVLPHNSELRICDRFDEGAFEIRPTLSAFSRQNEYLDLREFLDEVFPDQSDFFTKPFRSFCSSDGKLYGVPLIFSPWVIAFNPELIEKAGGALPRSGWGFEEFLELVRTLRRKLEPEQVLNFPHNPSIWRCLLFRAGGAILDRDDAGNCHVRLDDPRSREGLRRLRELVDALKLPDDREVAPCGPEELEQGRLAMLVASREDLNFNTQLCWRSVPLPLLPGGVDQIRPAADLLCVRRIVNDFDQIRQMLRMLLSPEVQNRAGELRYGIPIRRSAAIRSLHEDDPRDRAFFTEMFKIVPDHSMERPEINQLVSNGVPRIWRENADPDRLIDELAPALRMILRYGRP